MPTNVVIEPVKIVCPNCDEAYQLPPENIGKRAKCKVCANYFWVQPNEEKPQVQPEKAEPLLVNVKPCKRYGWLLISAILMIISLLILGGSWAYQPETVMQQIASNITCLTGTVLFVGSCLLMLLAGR